MRLRQLGTSQSVVYFGPPEVHQSMLNVLGKNRKHLIDSHDVVTWLLEQTCCNIEQLQPLYISQGLQYCRQLLSAKQNPDAASDPEQRKAYLKTLQQPEQYALEQLYSPDQKAKSRPVAAEGFVQIANYVEQLNAMKQKLRGGGNITQALTHQEVEQEREVAIEVEVIREVKKPSQAIGLPQPPLHREVKIFANTGRLAANSQICQQAFIILRKTALGRRLGITDSATRSKLFATEDFNNTVVTEWRKPLDLYSRPVRWILWSMITDTALIISDFEADALLGPNGPLRGKSPHCTHLIVYAAPVTKPMIVFDTFKFYSIPQLPDSWHPPTWLLRDLGLFAGRLYFDFDKQYSAVCEALGLPPTEATVTPIQSAAAMMEEALWRELPFPFADKEEEVVVKPEPFSNKPLLFMQEWLSIRRKGQDYSSTMMGELCRGRSLARQDWEKRERESEGVEMEGLVGE